MRILMMTVATYFCGSRWSKVLFLIVLALDFLFKMTLNSNYAWRPIPVFDSSILTALLKGFHLENSSRVLFFSNHFFHKTERMVMKFRAANAMLRRMQSNVHLDLGRRSSKPSIHTEVLILIRYSIRHNRIPVTQRPSSRNSTFLISIASCAHSSPSSYVQMMGLHFLHSFPAFICSNGGPSFST